MKAEEEETKEIAVVPRQDTCPLRGEDSNLGPNV